MKRIISIAVSLCIAGCWIKTTSTPVFKIPMVDNNAGISSCSKKDGQPIIYISDSLHRIPEWYVLVHERDHTSRMRQAGCEIYWRHYQSDSLFRLNEEASAYCAEARMMIWVGVPADTALRYVYEELRDHPASKGFTDTQVRNVLPCRFLRDARWRILLPAPTSLYLQRPP